jgi:hypothetical protein
MTSSSRFLHGFSKTAGGDFLLEVILPSGTITGVFRNLIKHSIAVEGVVDKINWTVVSYVALETEVLELTLPNELNLNGLGINMDEKDGRVVLKIPRKTTR